MVAVVVVVVVAVAVAVAVVVVVAGGVVVVVGVAVGVVGGGGVVVGVAVGVAMKRRKPNRPMSSERMQLLTEAVVARDGGCTLRHVGDCNGRLEPHHLVPQRLLKRFPDAAMVDMDLRAVVCCCRHHHSMIEASRIESPQPDGFDAFLDLYGFAPWWDERLKRRSEFNPSQPKGDNDA